MATLNYFEYMRDCIAEILKAIFIAEELTNQQRLPPFSVEPPRDAKHGDVSTNVAMVLAKTVGLNPHELAVEIAAGLLKLECVTSAKIAGPGFINIILANTFWYERLAEVLNAGKAYGESKIGKNKPINIEYVSANPTGPLHVGHGRGAVVGDTLANLFVKIGYNVTKEYYINDAGQQVDVLARSLHLRYLESLGEEIGKMPEGFYPGEYLVDVSKRLIERDGNRWKDEKESVWLEPLRSFAIDSMMGIIREDLAALGIVHGVFISERDIIERGGVSEVMRILEEGKLIYQGVLDPPKGMQDDDWEKRPQMLFRATTFGDDTDRPIKKSDDSWTYFATDMAYHLDKYNRGFKTMINIWGADHGGYVKRIQAALKAITDEGVKLDVRLCQMVNLLDAGEPIKMSKRAGTFVTLREVLDKVGKDVVRFIMLTRKNDAHLDFDLSRAVDQSRDNPVFYVQYAHARCCSVLRQATEMFEKEEISIQSLRNSNFKNLSDPAEIDLIKMMAAWPETLRGAAESYEPHRIAYYLHDLSALFHGLWAKGSKENTSLRFLSKEDHPMTLARLAMVKAFSTVIATGLEVMGVEPIQEM